MTMRKHYDEALLIELLAEGRLTQTEIAKRTGVSQSFVSKVSRGLLRPDLHRRVLLRCQDYLDEARRIGVQYVRSILLKHLREGLEGEGETPRRCREYLLDHLLFVRRGPVFEITESTVLPGVEADDHLAFYRWKSQTQGGPTDNPDDEHLLPSLASGGVDARGGEGG